MQTSRDDGWDNTVRKVSRYLFIGSTPLIDHSLFRLFAALDAGFALVQFPGTVRTTEIPTAAVARHEGHLDSILGFTLITLAGTAGFGHCYVSTTGCMSSRNVMSLDVVIIAGSGPHPPHSSFDTDNRSIFVAPIQIDGPPDVEVTDYH